MAIQQKNHWARKMAFAGILPFAALGFVACGDETVVEEAEEEGPAAVTAILGETVTLQTEVQEIVGSNVFTVGDGDTLILGTGMTDALEEGDEVQVTGDVRNFILTDIESEGFDFDDDESAYVVDYERELVVVADDVEELP
ncbi:hypothetical protein [Arthrobacter sp. CAN_C5]|uniref:hypothetical protein n=1 Tax=Arthrobacter sp. CAN_C5 TaxID=2760706 RepID=UPI001AE3A753|nr:hypothetical protein [Arthrobacter sp. CAN_C5]MBP2215035.1 ABC-type Fe3+-hydroxamate transport system substrate-binding protein [Arthrobacter sp. CAN_C5]